jgi:hypothetical protein
MTELPGQPELSEVNGPNQQNGLDALDDLPEFETMYLEVQPRLDGSRPNVDEVLALFRERRIVGVAVSGSRFGLDTPVIAKVAVTMASDAPVVLEVSDTGDLMPGRFTGDACQSLADALNAVVVADEYVQYSPGAYTPGPSQSNDSPDDREPDFIELDPRRQSIEQPPGFPNEWRVSPHKLDSRGIVFVSGTSEFTAAAIAHDTGIVVRSAEIAGGRLIGLPRGVVELPVEPTDDSRMPVVLYAQAGEAKYVHLVLGKGKKRLRMTVANLPHFSSELVDQEGGPAALLLGLITQPGLVAGPVQFDHPAFPYALLPAYERLTDPANTHAFFGEVAELLGIPPEVSQCADSGCELPSTGLREHDGDVAPRKRGWFRR